jgi:class 3 adenylate cyclase/tetratricopeptide (TPR) repeat protein
VSVHDTWAAYIPDLVVDLLGSPFEPCTFEAVVLVVDVRGFTALSELLAREGARGTEQLAATLSDFFDPLVELARGHGGRVLEFSGDAMTVVFPSDDTAAARAAGCALELQAAAARARTAIPAQLAIKAGLAQGTVLSLVAGDPERRLASVATGLPFRGAAIAQKHADTGEVIAAPALIADGLVAGRDAGEGHRAIVDAAAAVRRPQRQAVPALADAAARASTFLPPSYVERLRAGHSRLLGEHRRTTSLFAYPPGDVTETGDAHSIAEYVSSALETVEHHDGWLVQVDTDERGLRLLVSFGASVQHEDDADRALRCALELGDVGAGDSAIGIATGRVFCGPLGARGRHDFGTLGDSVNVAARLASYAGPGEVLVAEATCAQTRGRFALEAREAVTPRGKTSRVGVRRLRPGRLHGTSTRVGRQVLPLVGRDRELEQLRRALDRVAGGNGAAIGVAGSAGIGKTRLVAEVAARAADRGFTVCSGECDSYGADAFAVWRGVWRAFFGLGDDWSADRTRARLSRFLAEVDGESLDRLPLLGGLLRVPMPATALTRTLSGELAAASLEELLFACLRHRAAKTPLLLVLEDCHWIDADSLRLLDSIVRGAAHLPVLVVATYRPDDARVDDLRSSLTEELALDELAPHETRMLARAALTHHGCSPDLAEKIERRSQGNPLYVEELVNLVRHRSDALDLDVAGDVELPDRLTSLVLARLDRIPERLATLLKVASVAGREFDAELLTAGYPGLGDRATVARALRSVEELDLATSSGRNYRFRHALIAEVLYGSLSIAAREDLHERVAASIEARPAAADTLDLLAHHYGRSVRVDKQREYFRKAADAARERYASEAALAYYERLAPLLADSERAQVLLLAGETQQLVGRWREAERNYREALALARATADERTQAASEVALGRLLSYTESHETALASLREARDRFHRLGDMSGRRRALDSLAFTLMRAGQHDDARTAAEEQLALATELGDRVETSAALNNLGVIAWRAGDLEGARASLERALDDAAAAGDEVRVAHAANDLAGVYWDLGVQERALAYVRRGIEAASKIGYLQLQSLLIGNAGELYRNRGDNARALACYDEALEVAIALGDATQVALFAGNAGLAARALGRDDDAAELLGWALQQARRLGEPRLIAEVLFGLGRVAAGTGRAEEALALLEESRATACADGYAEIAVKAAATSIELRCALGRIDERAAVRELEAGVALAREPWARAVLLTAIAHLDPARLDTRGEAAALHRALYETSGNVEHRHAYAGLTGDALPAPARLPGIGLSGAAEADHLRAIVDRVRALGRRRTVESMRS